MKNINIKMLCLSIGVGILAPSFIIYWQYYILKFYLKVDATCIGNIQAIHVLLGISIMVVIFNVVPYRENLSNNARKPITFDNAIAFSVIIAIICIICILVVLFCNHNCLYSLFISTGKEDAIKCVLADKIKFFGWGVGGCIAIAGVAYSGKRTKYFDNNLEETQLNNILTLLANENEVTQVMAFSALVNFGTNQIDYDERKRVFSYINNYIYMETNKHYDEYVRDNEEFESEQLRQENCTYKVSKKIQRCLNSLFYKKIDNKTNDEIIQRNEFIDLSYSILTKCSLDYLELNGISLTHCHLEYARLRDSNLKGVRLMYSSLFEINFTGSDLSYSDLSDTDLRKSDLQNAILIDSKLINVKLHNAELKGVNFENAKLFGTNLRELNLCLVNLQGADLSRANLSSTDLRLSNLKNANLSYANLRDSNLKQADLQGANLLCAILIGANLSHANLTGVNLTNANLDGARCTDAIFTDSKLIGTILENDNLN